MSAPLLDLECVVYMGTEDMRRQRPNVERMALLGARVEPVEAGARTLKEAVSAAIRDWVTNVEGTHYVIGSVGGGSNAIGAFTAFLGDGSVELVGVEAAGEGLETRRHSAPLTTGAKGVLHGALSAVLQDEDGQILEAHSISAGLDYPGVGPQHAYLRDEGRVRHEAVADADALRAFRRLAELEGIIPALEPAHALAFALANPAGDLDLIVLSGRGDKDLAEVLDR